MAAQSSFHVEIQNLKDALTASQKQAERYAQLVLTLSVELDDLRNNICHSCKTRLASGTTFVPSTIISATQGSPDIATSVSATTVKEPSMGSSRSLASSPNTNKPLPVPPEPEAAHNLSFSETTPSSTHPGSNEDQPERPQWSVVYHAEVEQALEFHLAHTLSYDSQVHSLQMSPNGKRLAVGGDGITHLYELETGSKICVFGYVKERIGIYSLHFSPNSQLLATGTSDRRVRIWDINMKRMRAILKGHQAAIYKVVFSPNGRFLVSASGDRSVRIWKIRDGSSKVLPVVGTPNLFISVAFSDDGRFIAAGNYDNSLWIWDSRTHRLVAKWQGHEGSVWCTQFTADGKGLISGGADKTVKYWDVNLLRSRQGLSMGMVVDEEQGFPFVWSILGHSGLAYSIALFPDNAQWIATGFGDGSVRVWDTQSGVCQLMLQGRQVSRVDVSRTQNFLAIAGQDGHVTVWKYRLL